MATTIGTFDLDEFQALVRMSQRTEPFVARVAGATLAIVEARRDAEIRAATAEAALDAERELIDAIRLIVAGAGADSDEVAEAFRQIARLVS